MSLDCVNGYVLCSQFILDPGPGGCSTPLTKKHTYFILGMMQCCRPLGLIIYHVFCRVCVCVCVCVCCVCVCVLAVFVSRTTATLSDASATARDTLSDEVRRSYELNWSQHDIAVATSSSRSSAGHK